MGLTLKALGIAHRYNDATEALADFSLELNRGRIACLLGPSGCGKSTALRLIAGLEHLQQGEIHLDGALVADDRLDTPPERRNVGLVFQDYALFPHLTVRANVAFGLEGRPPAERAARAEELLRRVGCDDLADAYPHALSGGQQQRVALARALAPAPKLLLLDEPFSGLDARLREAVREETLDILRDAGAAAVMVTHDPEEAMHMADHIVLMQAGRVAQAGPPEALYFRPLDPFVVRFFSETNELPARLRGDGWADTVLGAAPVVGGGAAGDAGVLLTRLEGVSLRPQGEGVRAVATDVRLLGAAALVHLHVEDGGDGLKLKARCPARAAPPRGAMVGLALDPSLCYVFPAGDSLYTQTPEESRCRRRKNPFRSDG